MVRRLFQRLIVAVVRFLAAGVLVMGLVEVAFCVIGGSQAHLWEPASWEGVPESFSPRHSSWPDHLLERVAASARVLVIAVPVVWLVGYAWGILGARLRRFHGSRWLAAPFSLFACVPGFWFVGLVAIHSYFHWQRPGFADDLVVERGPDLLAWWNAAVVAVPLAVAGIAWQVRAVAVVLESGHSRPWVRGLHAAGADDEEIFYRRVIPHALPSLAALADRIFPVMLGGLVVVETAFHYPGIGDLFVASLRAGSYPGIVLSILVLTLLVIVAACLREWLSNRSPLP